jgi:ribosome-binding protein aMBF1 (putative translation factor)
MNQGMGVAAARRIPVERPPSASDVTKVDRQQEIWRTRIGANIRRFRQEAGLSQAQLSMRADLSQNYLSECERGMRGVTIDLLVRLAYHLGKEPPDFLAD